MKAHLHKVRAHCRCGKVSFELVGRPMMRATCYCDSCQAAARVFGDLLGAPVSLGKNGGTDVGLYRKDRIGQVIGRSYLQEHRLTAESPTRRMVAGCCNTPMLLDFTKGFWLSFYLACLSATDDQQSPNAGVGQAASPDGSVYPRPTLRAHSASFMAKLFLSWAAMGFRTPKVAW